MEILQRQKILFYAAAAVCVLACGYLPIYCGAPLLTVCLAVLARARFGFWGASALALPSLSRSSWCFLATQMLCCYFATALFSGSLLWMFAAHHKFEIEWAPQWGVLVFQIFFQSLNEEILFRGWLLSDLKKRIWIAMILAFVFASSHLLTYGVFTAEVLSWQVFATLFLFGFATTLLVYRSGHIASVWALHAGWNTGRFVFSVKRNSPPEFLSEAEVFQILEGSIAVVLLACLFASIVLRQSFFVSNGLTTGLGDSKKNDLG
jgi:membrane protease YdiL (CAAX protease family)